MSKKLIYTVVLAALFLAANLPVFAQLMDGEVRVTVVDPSGSPVPATVVLTSQNPQFRTEAQANVEGQAQLTRLPRGVYALTVSQQGFTDYHGTVQVRSAVPQQIDVELTLGPVTTTVTVTGEAPLLNREQPNVVVQTSSEQLNEALGSTLGRSTVNVVTSMPGWLVEANGVLHPRGSEYDTQYVVDGMPMYDNRSIGYAPAFENNELAAVNVMTGGIPAEYGRRLGGVIALDTRRVEYLGHSTSTDFQASGYNTYSGSVAHQYRTSGTELSLGANAGHTGRYLDPPSLENYTNKASSVGANGRFDVDLSDRDRLTFYLRSSRTGFLVPNDLVQEEAGQRQDRRSLETAGQVHYQHTFSASSLLSVQGMVRDLGAQLWSNKFSTPVYAQQDRGFRQGVVNASLTIDKESHTFKIGGDYRISHLREQFRYADAGQLPNYALDFFDTGAVHESSFYMQDQMRFGNFSANAGFRVDRYSLKIHETAISPRLAASYYIPAADLLLRASYDRIFQPPPSENLLLSTAAAVLELDSVEGAIPVPASRGNFFEVGLRKPIFNRLRLDVSHYWRRFQNAIDDDVFLNTGLSFPITWDHARVEGTEVRLEMPRWKWFSSTLSYANMLGFTTSPITGGLFVKGGEAVDLRDVAVTFPITQDQRNTFSADLRVEPTDRVWFTTAFHYGSGLPVELEDEDEADAASAPDMGGEDAQQISQAILNQIDYTRGRVKPNHSLDLSAGVRVWEQGRRHATLQFDVRNVTNRLNVINFSGLFSGTSLATGRLASFQLRADF